MKRMMAEAAIKAATKRAVPWRVVPLYHVAWVRAMGAQEAVSLLHVQCCSVTHAAAPLSSH